MSSFEFVKFALSQQILCFGSFTLKSGRVSPYFFNLGLICSGEALKTLSKFYAQLLLPYVSGSPRPILFGPSYKGIPLATAAAIELCNTYGLDCQVAFDRKEAKLHGEGGILQGANVKDRDVIIIDDVMTAGTAVRQSIEKITAAGGRVVGVVIALDRQESIDGQSISATQFVSEEHKIWVKSIANMADIIKHLESEEDSHLDKMLEYRNKYGV